ncbi:hypothetical protein GALMADRAFT_103536 [Galerina marginata CBS 339.88]|uniref:BTB domain-containing protein n=1 Tax=Galerina marginata (strain CBS 339.88) TaxID=685588 RepID=A0A067ST18_GALM3|nr:hypothetical protein GALMADRAFT_103536 [Galerina marginata CBS 339.88]
MSQSAQEITEPQRVPDLWFDDADVVFQAGQKLFRVHRGILCARSPIFRDMFSIPPPDQEAMGAGSTIDGCCLINLPDAQQDVYCFFLAIFDASFFEPPPSVHSISILASILRMSHKYDVGFLRYRAISHLNRLFPPHMVPSFIKSNNVSNLRTTVLEIIEPAYTANVRWIIPTVFLSTVQIKLEEIFESQHWNVLPTAIQQAYLRFREIYLLDRERMPRWIVFLPSKQCAYPAQCQMAARSYMVGYRQLIEKSEKKMLTRRELEVRSCPHCASYILAQATVELKERWNGFPINLGLPNWQTLRKEKSDLGKPTIPT